MNRLLTVAWSVCIDKRRKTTYVSAGQPVDYDTCVHHVMPCAAGKNETAAWGADASQEPRCSSPKTKACITGCRQMCMCPGCPGKGTEAAPSRRESCSAPSSTRISHCAHVELSPEYFNIPPNTSTFCFSKNKSKNKKIISGTRNTYTLQEKVWSSTGFLEHSRT